MDSEPDYGIPDPTSWVHAHDGRPGAPRATPLRARAVEVLEKLVDVERAEEFLAALAPEVTWKIPGDWPGISGIKGRAEVESFVRRSFPAGFPEGLALEIHATYQDGDVVLVEFTAAAKSTARKRAYRNEYCFVLEFRDGLVVRLREYMDTLYAHTVLHVE